MMEAIKEYIIATAAVLVLRTVFADAQPAPYEHHTLNTEDSIGSTEEFTQLPSMTETAEAETAEEDDGAK